MSQLKQTELGTFICKDEYIDGIKIQSFLGIPYAKSERFGMPEMTGLLLLNRVAFRDGIYSEIPAKLLFMRVHRP